MEFQEKFIEYLTEIEDTGTADKKEVVSEFLQFFKSGYDESAQLVMSTHNEEKDASIGEMKLTHRWIRMIEEIKEEVKNPKPEGEEL